jgi:hypothetical protein
LLYELDDLLFDNRLNSAKRFLAGETQFDKQVMILDAIAMLDQYAATKKNKGALKKLISDIKQYKQGVGEELLNKYFDFEEWIENKLEQI